MKFYSSCLIAVSFVSAADEQKDAELKTKWAKLGETCRKSEDCKDSNLICVKKETKAGKGEKGARKLTEEEEKGGEEARECLPKIPKSAKKEEPKKEDPCEDITYCKDITDELVHAKNYKGKKCMQCTKNIGTLYCTIEEVSSADNAEKLILV